LHCDARPEIDCPIFGDLAGKEMNAIAIHQDLFTTLDLDVVSYPMAIGILRETPVTHEQLPAQELAVEPDPSVID
jgi:hypothetical protein